jgi:hypothetical protein
MWSDYTSTGTRPAEASLNTVIEAARVTGDHDLLETIGAAHDRMEQASALVREPLPEQHAQIMERQRLADEGQLSPGQAGVLKDLEKKNEAIVKGLADNPIATTAVNFSDKFKVPPPLNLGDDAQMAAGLQYRGRIAAFAAKNWDIPAPSALDSADLKQFEAALQTPDPAAKMRLLGTLASTLPADVRNATYAKLGEKSPEMMVNITAASIGGDVGQSIMRGQDAMKIEPRSNPEHESTKNDYYAAIDKVLPRDAFPFEGRTGAYKTAETAIKARYADMWMQAGKPGKLNEDMLQQAVTDVTGGILSHNGGKLIAPTPGMSQGQFDSLIYSLTDRDLQGVTTRSGRPINANYVRDQAQLESIGQGRYWIRFGSAPAGYAMQMARAPIASLGTDKMAPVASLDRTDRGKMAPIAPLESKSQMAPIASLEPSPTARNLVSLIGAELKPFVLYLRNRKYEPGGLPPNIAAMQPGP